MMLSVMVVGAGAAFSDQSKIKNTEAVDMCTALNIIGGYPDGTFKPEGNITRAEVTKMICVALNGGKEPNLATNATPTFSDVRTNANSAWAEKYIESCYAQGIVSGVGGGKFAPAGNVTGTQLAKMLLVSLGYKSENEGFTGNAWATNVNVRASQKGLYDGLESMDPAAALTRDSAAQMIWNALNAYEVEYVTNLIADKDGKLSTQITVQDKIDISSKERITLLEDKYESKTAVGEMSKIEWNDSDKEYKYTIGTGENAPTFQSASDFSDLFGMKVKVVYTKDKKTNDDKVFGIVPKDSKVLATGILNDIEYSDTNEIKVDGTKYKTDGNVLGENALQAQAFNDKNKVNLFKDTNNLNDSLAGYYSATVIDNDNDGKADLVVYLPVTVAKVTYAGTKSITAGASYKYEDHDSASGIEKDDYVVITAKDNTTKERANIVKAEIVSGEVTATKADKIQIGSKWYTLAGGMKVSDYSVGDSYDVAVYNGFAFSSDATEEASKDILFISGAKAFDEYAGEKNGTVDAKVYFLDGSYKTVTITKVDGEKLKLADRQTAQQLSDSLTGTLYTYTVKDGNYELKTLNDSNNKAGYKNYAGKTATFAEKKETIGGYAIADDAVIFVKDKEETKVMTGKTVKDWSNDFGTSGEVLVSEINGIKYAKVAALINTSATKPDASGDLKYAYLVDDTYLGQTQDEDKDDALVFTVFGENGAATLYDTDDYGKITYAVDNFKKGQLIEYKEDGKEIKDVKVVAEGTLNTTNIQTVAITGIEDKNEGLVYFLDGKNAGGVSYKLDKDAYFVKIDDANTSAEAGKRSEVTTAQSETTGKKTVNAYIATETDAGKTTIVAVYYDVDKLDEGTQYDENIVTLPASTTAATIKTLADGVYIPTDTAFDVPENVTTPVESNRIFKFTAPTEATYTLTIKNDKDVVVYTETSSSLSEGAHFFFISTNASAAHPNTGADSTYGKAPFAKGDYTFTISGSSDVLSGSFTVA